MNLNSLEIDHDHFPVGVWVIEHAIIVSVTVRSPTVIVMNADIS